MEIDYITILIFTLSAFLLIFSIVLWFSRPKIDSSKEKPSKKSKKRNEEQQEELN